MGIEHAFDAKGFLFAVPLFLVSIGTGIGLHAVLVSPPTTVAAAQPASLVVIHEAMPAAPFNEYESAATSSSEDRVSDTPDAAPIVIQTVVPPHIIAAPSQIPAVKAVSAVPAQPIVDYSTTTPKRAIALLTIGDVIPSTGKFIAADLSAMRLTLYQNGKPVASYPILNTGKPGTTDETPAGFYTVLTKEEDHFNKGQQVHMPWSMQFYANYFIHGWPYYEDGHQVDPNFSGGCIRMSTSDAEKIFAFATVGTKVFIYNPKTAPSRPSLALAPVPIPSVSAPSYLVADLDTRDVFLERKAGTPRPIGAATDLMTALVANETIMSYKSIPVKKSALFHNPSLTDTNDSFNAIDLLYPLLLEGNDYVANKLASYYDANGFVKWMNATAKSLDMRSTHFASATASSANESTTDDLFRLASYLLNQKSFIFNITRTPAKQLVADNGDVYQTTSANEFANSAEFLGGSAEPVVSAFSMPIGGVTRRFAVIVLSSPNATSDAKKLADWFTAAAEKGSALSSSACVGCALPTTYRKIEE